MMYHYANFHTLQRFIITIKQKAETEISSGHILQKNTLTEVTLFSKIYEGRLQSSWTGGICAAVMQREAVTVMPSCSGGGNVVVA
jgi:hypothetical protein